MTCKKSDLISAINTFGAARSSGDDTLLAFSVNLVQSLLDTIEFEGELKQNSNQNKSEEIADE